jgi:hypothetical protein
VNPLNSEDFRAATPFFKMLAYPSAFLVAALALAPGPTAPKDEPRKVVELARRPRVDGELKDLLGATPLLTRAATGHSPGLTARAAVFGDTLYLGIDVTDEHPEAAQVLTLGLHAPEAGIAAPGHVFYVGPDGKHPSTPEEAPAYAQAALEAAVVHTPKGLGVELALPLLALPRLPARGPLLLELCLASGTPDNVEGATAQRLSACPPGAPAPVRLELPESMLSGLRQHAPPEVVALEARPGGWVGFGERVEPRWIFADKPLTLPSLRALVSESSLDPSALRLYIPDRMTLPDGGAVLAVLTGQDPFEAEASCAPDREVRFLLYRVRGRVAERVLDWPARSCALGRALSVSLDPTGELTVGYSSGATERFIWSRDHFERTEYGNQ